MSENISSANSSSTDEALLSLKSSSSASSIEYVHDIMEDSETLIKYTKNFCAKNVYSVFSEYATIIRESTVETQKKFEKHKELNRYLEVPCFESTRVVVKHPTEDHDYIHANYVDGFREHKKFILTQSPLNQTIEQYWSMIWNEKVVVILSLACIDGLRCPIYLPLSVNESKKFGSFEIKNLNTRQIRDAYYATNLLVTKNGEKISRKLLHLSFYCWPDKGLPVYPTEVLNLITDMNHNRKLFKTMAVADGWLLAESTQAPICVHCIAGVGRSAAIVAIDICQRKLDASFSSKNGPVIDIKDTVCRIRSQRAMAVQKPEQYLFIQMSLIEYALRKHYYSSVENLLFSNFMQVEDV